MLTAWKGTEKEETVKLVNVKNLNEVVNSISWQDLSELFSIISKSIQRQLENDPETKIPITTGVSIDAYELAEALGTSRVKGVEAIKRAQKAVYQFVGLVGVAQGKKTPGLPDEHTLINYWGMEDNIIKFDSPYLTDLLMKLRAEAVRKRADGSIERSRNGTPLFKPFESFLIHSDILKERDKLAIENVKIIVSVIESGGKRAHISAREIIKRNSALNYKIQSAPGNQRPSILKRVFSNTWKYLKVDTDLLSRYENITLPDEKNVPSMSTLDTVYSFKNDGKKRTPDT